MTSDQLTTFGAAMTDSDWGGVMTALDVEGWTVVPGLLDADACDRIAGMYATNVRCGGALILGQPANVISSCAHEL